MTAVQKKENGQYVVTVPKDIAEGMELEGADLSWKVTSRNRMKVEIDRDD